MGRRMPAVMTLDATRRPVRLHVAAYGTRGTTTERKSAQFQKHRFDLHAVVAAARGGGVGSGGGGGGGGGGGAAAAGADE